MATTTVGVKLNDETRARLKNLGHAKQRSTHWMVKEAVARYLDVEERYERERAEDLAPLGALRRDRPRGAARDRHGLAR